MMRLRPEFCKAQIGRLFGKPFTPACEEAQAELIGTLKEVCESEEHAKAVVDHFCQSDGPCPPPHSIRSYAYETRTHKPGPSHHCRKCSGCGWQLVIKTPKAGPFAGVRYECAARCDCWADGIVQEDVA